MTAPYLIKSAFQVNTTITGTQAYGQLAAQPDGSYSSVFIDFSTGTPLMRGRHYDANGNALAGEVFLEGSGQDSFPDVAVTPDGRTHVAFTLNNDTYVGNYNLSLGGASFTSIEVSGDSGLRSTHPAITAYADGSLFVTYTLQNSDTDWDIIGQRVNPAGALVGGTITIFDDTDRSDFSQVATLTNGNVVIVYESQFVGSTTDHDVFFQIRQSGGTPVKAHTGLAGGTTGNLDEEPDVAALKSGGFVAVWTSGTGSAADIKADVYDNAGTLLSAANGFTVNTTTTGQQGEAHVTALNDGGFIVTWEDNNLINQKAQRFDSLGNRVGKEFVTHSGNVFQSSVTQLANGRIVMSFDDFSAGNYNVFNEIFYAPTSPTSFNGDLKSDIAWYNDATGLPVVFLMNGLTSISGTVVGPANGAAWDMVATGDLNGDGNTDMIWQNTSSGDVVGYLMNGTSIVSAAVIGSPGPSFRVVGSGDLNADGNSDIVLQDGNGQAVAWLMNGTTIQSAAGLGPANGAAWSIKAIGDLNGDNRADLVWENTNGSTVGYLMDGSTIVLAQQIAGANGTDFQVRGVGDLDGNGNNDIVWQYANGQAGAWLMNGLSISSAGSIGGINGSQWQIRDVSDLNGDGKMDLVWEDMTQGQAVGFLQNGLTITAAAAIGGANGSDWKIV